MPQRHPSIDLVAHPHEPHMRRAPGESPREVGLPPLQEQLPTEWTSAAPQATERAKKPISDWVAWLVALAVLLFLATFGFQAMTWALRGGWHWLWMVVGLPVFGIFSVTSVTMVVGRLRERRRIRVALANMSLERGEGFRVGEPLTLRLRATVAAAAHDGERTVAPQRIVMRLIRRSLRGEAKGGGALVDECCDEAVAHREDAREGRLLYACELCASPAPAAGAADAADAADAMQWSVELHDPAVEGGAPFVVAALRRLPAR